MGEGWVVILNTVRKIISEIQQQRSGKKTRGSPVGILDKRFPDRGNITGIRPCSRTVGQHAEWLGWGSGS